MSDIGLRTADPIPEALSLRVLREQVASIYAVFNTTFVARVGFLAVFAGFFYVHTQQQLAVMVFVGLHLVLYLFIFFQPRWTAREADSASPLWARRVTWLLVWLGVADALGPWLFVPADNLPVTSVLMVMIMGSCARAVQTIRAVKSALFGYLLPAMLGLITALVWHGDSWHAFLAVFATMFLALLLRVGLQENQRLAEALLLRFENEALAQRLSEQVAATERASAEKTRFLAAASHDLRQPLHAIALFGSALENELRERPEGAHAERLMRAVNALGASLDTLLDISRLDAGVVQPVQRPVSLDALFVQLNSVFSAQAEHKQLQLRLRASGLQVMSDAHLLSRMLSNLIDNAIKFTARGGVAVVARARGDRVWVEVCDTGIGIGPEQRERIFEEFYQCGPQGRDRTRGLGIGLSIVRRLADLLGHPLQLRSRPGRGTRFRLQLPRAMVDATTVASAVLATGTVAPLPAALPPSVLLVDDEADIRLGMVELMRAWGVEVTAVGDGAQAQRLWEAASEQGRGFDLLISDFRLGDGSGGLDILHRYRQRFGPSTPVLLITGETSPARLQQVQAAGVPVLFKPVVAPVLREMLARLCVPAVAPENAEASGEGGAPGGPGSAQA